MTTHIRKLFGETLIYGLAGVLTTLTGVILVPIFTRVFSPTDYGVISLITSLMALASIFVVLALDSASHVWYWDTKDRLDRVTTIASWAWCQIVVAASIAGILISIAPTIADRILNEPSATWAIRFAAATLPMMTFTQVLLNWLRMQRRPWPTFGYAASLTVSVTLLNLFFAVMLDMGITGVFLGQFTAYCLGTAVAISILKGWIDPRRFSGTRVRVMLRYGLPLVPAAISFWIVGLLDRYFIEFYSSRAEVGLYQVGYQVAALVGLATGAFQQAWGPFALSIKEELGVQDVYARALLAFVSLGALLCTAVSIFSPEILRLFTTPLYYQAASVIPYLAFSYLMMGLMYIAGLGPSLVKRSGPTGIAITLGAISTVILNFLLTPRLGMQGAAIATLISWAIVPVYVFRRAQQMYAIPYAFRATATIVGVSFALSMLGQLPPPASATGITLKLVILLGLTALLAPTLNLRSRAPRWMRLGSSGDQT